MSEVLWERMSVENRVKTLPNLRHIELGYIVRKDCPSTAKICQLYFPRRTNTLGENSTAESCPPVKLSSPVKKRKRRKRGRKETPSLKPIKEDCSSNRDSTLSGCSFSGYERKGCLSILTYDSGLGLQDSPAQDSIRPKVEIKSQADANTK